MVKNLSGKPDEGRRQNLEDKTRRRLYDGECIKEKQNVIR